MWAYEAHTGAVTTVEQAPGKSPASQVSKQGKPSRVAVRMSAEDEAVIRAGAEVAGTTVTDFMVSAATAKARDELADRRVFFLDEAAWQQFNAILDRPVQHKPALAKLFAEPSIFAGEAAGDE